MTVLDDLSGFEFEDVIEDVFRNLGYENVYNISGWSENALSFIEHAEDPKQVIDEVNAFEPA